MQLSVWALSIAGFSVLFSSATPVERLKPEHFPSTTTNSTIFSSVSSLIPTLSATPQNATPTPTTTFTRQTTTTSQPGGIPLPPSTVTAQVPTSSPVTGSGCNGGPDVSFRNKRDPNVCAW